MSASISRAPQLFKALKQNLRIKTFVGTSANALHIQIWTALIALLVLKYCSGKRASTSIGHDPYVNCRAVARRQLGDLPHSRYSRESENERRIIRSQPCAQFPQNPY
ncbi:MAG: hypothetical protein K2Y23_06710 [Cyanobacteria bacterium]|nr:hypothetical protein [Cyanobacteriota bacterium]